MTPVKTALAWTGVLLAALSLSGACSPTPPADDDMGGGGSNGSDETGGAPSDGSGGQTTGGRSTGGEGGDGGASGGQSSSGGSGGTPATCGDGEVDTGEECDDEGESAACNANCTLSDCGDSIVNEAAGEDCDEAGEETATCNDDCTESECGDGVHNATDGEECDDAGDSDACDEDCTLVECGDDYVNETAGEECEGELTYEGDELTINYCVECKKNVCGDSLRMEITLAGQYACAQDGICSDIPAEDCDSGGIDTNECDYDCTTATCRDGHWNAAAYEDCDDGNSIDDDECSNACVANP